LGFGISTIGISTATILEFGISTIGISTTTVNCNYFGTWNFHYWNFNRNYDHPPL
jgi:hypothetical protein